MTDDDDTINVSNALDADERALTIHEAGHAVIAHALGADLVFIEIYISRPNPDDGKMGGGKTCHREPFADDVKTLAVCVAGYKAELAFAADEQRLAKMFAREERLAGDSSSLSRKQYRGGTWACRSAVKRASGGPARCYGSGSVGIAVTPPTPYRLAGFDVMIGKPGGLTTGTKEQLIG